MEDLQCQETSPFSFPDDFTIEVPVLQTLKAGLKVAEMLGVEQNIWNPTYWNVFTLESMRSLAIPGELEPVQLQLMVPHHPLFDILPWPNIRTKLISVFSLPIAIRPPPARDPLAILNMIYDIDDPTEGFRVRGCNGVEGTQWEVGQAFFRNWWWALDREVVSHSNRLRAARGAPLLEIGSF